MGGNPNVIKIEHRELLNLRVTPGYNILADIKVGLRNMGYTVIKFHIHSPANHIASFTFSNREMVEKILGDRRLPELLDAYNCKISNAPSGYANSSKTVNLSPNARTIYVRNINSDLFHEFTSGVSREALASNIKRELNANIGDKVEHVHIVSRDHLPNKFPNAMHVTFKTLDFANEWLLQDTHLDMGSLLKKDKQFHHNIRNDICTICRVRNCNKYGKRCDKIRRCATCLATDHSFPCQFPPRCNNCETQGQHSTGSNFCHQNRYYIRRKRERIERERTRQAARNGDISAIGSQVSLLSARVDQLSGAQQTPHFQPPQPPPSAWGRKNTLAPSKIKPPPKKKGSVKSRLTNLNKNISQSDSNIHASSSSHPTQPDAQPQNIPVIQPTALPFNNVASTIYADSLYNAAFKYISGHVLSKNLDEKLFRPMFDNFCTKNKMPQLVLDPPPDIAFMHYAWAHEPVEVTFPGISQLLGDAKASAKTFPNPVTTPLSHSQESVNAVPTPKVTPDPPVTQPSTTPPIASSTSSIPHSPIRPPQVEAHPASQSYNLRDFKSEIQQYLVEGHFTPYMDETELSDLRTDFQVRRNKKFIGDQKGIFNDEVLDYFGHKQYEAKQARKSNLSKPPQKPLKKPPSVKTGPPTVSLKDSICEGPKIAKTNTISQNLSSPVDLDILNSIGSTVDSRGLSASRDVSPARSDISQTSESSVVSNTTRSGRTYNTYEGCDDLVELDKKTLKPVKKGKTGTSKSTNAVRGSQDLFPGTTQDTLALAAKTILDIDKAAQHIVDVPFDLSLSQSILSTPISLGLKNPPTAPQQVNTSPIPQTQDDLLTPHHEDAPLTLQLSPTASYNLHVSPSGEEQPSDKQTVCLPNDVNLTFTDPHIINLLDDTPSLDVTLTEESGEVRSSTLNLLPASPSLGIPPPISPIDEDSPSSLPIIPSDAAVVPVTDTAPTSDTDHPSDVISSASTGHSQGFWGPSVSIDCSDSLLASQDTQVENTASSDLNLLESPASPDHPSALIVSNTLSPSLPDLNPSAPHTTSSDTLSFTAGQSLVMDSPMSSRESSSFFSAPSTPVLNTSLNTSMEDSTPSKKKKKKSKKHKSKSPLPELTGAVTTAIRTLEGAELINISYKKNSKSVAFTSLNKAYDAGLIGFPPDKDEAYRAAFQELSAVSWPGAITVRWRKK